MGINKDWLKNQPFARNVATRTIDRETILDLLGMVIYEADRSAVLEDAGFCDNTPSVDCLFDYVLDALRVPAESAAFSRSPFEQAFYNDYWLEKKYESLEEVLTALESLRDSFAERASSAEDIRAGFRLVEDRG